MLPANRFLNDSSEYNEESLSGIIYNSNDKILDCRLYIKELFYLLGIKDRFTPLEEKLMYNYKYRTFYTKEGSRDKYGTTKEEIASLIFKENDKEFDFSKLDYFEKFKFILFWNYCEEIGKSFISKEHIGPLMARASNRIDSLAKLFIIKEDSTTFESSNIDVVSLIDVRVDLRKIIPLIICKKLYYEKKAEKINSLNTSLHIIIDEAHNILSTSSIRESEEWKDYRLECFEEIIKEGRKFGTFLTISSQRPSDISDTIISQLHNYFIHRLVNEEDLRKIHRTISFSDKATNEMISILPAGGCIFAGIASNFPILARIDILPESNQPKSENVNISQIW